MGKLIVPGGAGVDVSEVTTTPDKVLEGYKFVDSEGDVQEGTLQYYDGSYH